MSKHVTLENTLAGGFGLPTGQLVPGNGSMVVEPEIWAASKDHPVVKARIDAGTLIVDGKGKTASVSGDRDENGDTREMAEMRRVFDASFAQQGDALTASQSEVTTLQGRVSELESQLVAKEAEIAAIKAGTSSAGSGAYTVLDKGRGWFAITQDGKEVTKSLREDDVKDFASMSDPDKTAFVELHKAD